STRWRWARRWRSSSWSRCATRACSRRAAGTRSEETSMMFSPGLVGVMAVLTAQAPPPPPTAGARMVKETAYARVAPAQSIARDAGMIAAVVAKNKSGETMEEIHRKDAAWMANPKDPLRQQVVRAPCSSKLRALVQADPLVVEAFTMDSQGALVCSIS